MTVLAGKMRRSIDEIAMRKIGLALALAFCCSAGGEAFRQNEDRRQVESEIRQYYADMKCKDGRLVPAFESHFWSGATITTVWSPNASEKPRVVVASIPGFVGQSPAGACSKPIFEEGVTSMEVKVHNGLAQGWARYHAKFGEQSRLIEWNGVDAFTLLEHENRWKIVSIAFRADAGGPGDSERK